MTVTGGVLRPRSVNDGSELLARLVPSPIADERTGDPEPAERRSGEEILSVLLRRKCFRLLFEHGCEPSDNHSVKDFALCCMIADETRDPAVIERIMSRSALGKRKKWRLRKDYRDRTIAAALRHTRFDPQFEIEIPKDAKSPLDVFVRFRR